MIRAFALSVAQLGDPRILRVLALSVLLTLAVFAAAGIGAGWALKGTNPCDTLGLGNCPIGGGVNLFGGLLLFLVLAWFLFPAVAIGIVSLFVDSIVDAVEARHYPAAAAAARNPGWGETARLGLASAGRVLLLNLIALPLYAALVITGVGLPIAFLLVNAVALARDLPDMVAVRHLDPAARRAWRRRTRGQRFLLGLAAAALFLVPFANLLAPVLGAAMATHLFHRSRP